MIPKIIHYCWFGGNPLPPLAEKCINSWKKYCPDYKIIEWNESNYDISKNQYMKDAYDSKKWGFVSDYARKDIIYEHGGIYLDTDVEIIKPIDDLLENKAFLGMENPGIVNTGSGFGSEKGKLIIKEMRDLYNDISFINKDGSFNLTASPFYESKIMQKYGLQKINKTQIIDEIVVYTTDYFSPKNGYGGSTKITNNTYSIHHFIGSWIPLKNKIKGKIYLLLKKIFGEEKAEKIRSKIKRG